MERTLRGAFYLTSFLLLSILLVGCASIKPMPLQRDKNSAEDNKSIIFGTLTIKNHVSPYHQPTLKTISVENNRQTFIYEKPTLFFARNDRTKEYFFSIDVDPGKVNLEFAHFVTESYVSPKCKTKASISKSIKVPEKSIIYAGRYEIDIISKTNFKDPSVPSGCSSSERDVLGFSKGTFDIKFINDYEADASKLKTEFPYLANSQIINGIP